MTIRQSLDKAIKELEHSRVPGARLDAELLLAHVMDKNRAWILAHDDQDLAPGQEQSFTKLIAKRASRIPVVHLTGTREFYGLDFQITPDVLTPRVETEQIVEWAIRYAPKNSSLIDIGTGSGAIAVAIAHHRPDLTITATEVSPQALEVARNNANTHLAAIELIESDLWGNVPNSFDTVVTNLPYLQDSADLMAEVKKEPAVALFGGTDGLDLYRRFLKELPKHLNPGGYLFTESDPWQHQPLISLASATGLAPVEQGYFVLGFKDQSR